MWTEADMGLWQGRIDQDPAGDASRWHQRVQLLAENAAPGVALLGICCDAGVRRNRGRPGAAAGPQALRRALAALAWHAQTPIYDAGDLHCKGDDLEALQQAQTEKVFQLLSRGHFPLLLGGGHEIAYGSFSGLHRFLADQQDRPLGIINFDAHFDFRHSERPHSGTPFRQIAVDCQKEGQTFAYYCLGISKASNTQSLFARADSLQVNYLTDTQLSPWDLAQAEQCLQKFIAACGSLYLSIDLDVLPAWVAPGVSAPAARGVEPAVLEHLLQLICRLAGGKLRLVDIAEYNPSCDIAEHTARQAARLCHLLVTNIRW